MKTKKLAVCAMLSAMCAVLGYISIDLGGLKVTFESLPVLLGGLLFGPVPGLTVGAVGTLISQLLKYGVSATTVLWMLPYMVCGLVSGLYTKSRGYELNKKQTAFIVIFTEILILLINTFVIYIDAKLYGYYTEALIWGSLALRIVICIAKSIAFALVLPMICKAVRKFVQ